MPTFIFFRNKVFFIYNGLRNFKLLWFIYVQAKIDRLQGGNQEALEQKVKQHYGSEDAEDDSTVQGYVRIIVGPHLKESRLIFCRFSWIWQHL